MTRPLKVVAVAKLIVMSYLMLAAWVFVFAFKPAPQLFSPRVLPFTQAWQLHFARQTALQSSLV